ncbi:MAG: DUF554 domain-containing protein [Armatimonadetes bacterium]|nr:DUF554 domain-containing protein [Armatimonadota bacterium]
MIGTWINVGTVLTGGTLGLLIGARMNQRYHQMAVFCIGLVTVALSIKMVLSMQDMLPPVLALVTGGLIGEALRIESRIDAMMLAIEKRFASRSASGEDGMPLTNPNGSRFSQGFITTSLLFCVGPLTILGCLQDGLRGDYTLLALKSMLDGITSFFYSATLGPGVLMSAVTVLVVQGGLTLAAASLQPLFPSANAPTLIALVAVGGMMLFGLGLRLLEIKKAPVANLLPALILAPIYQLLWSHYVHLH